MDYLTAVRIEKNILKFVINVPEVVSMFTHTSFYSCFFGQLPMGTLTGSALPLHFWNLLSSNFMNPTLMLTSEFSFPFWFIVELFADFDFLLWNLANLCSSFLFFKALKNKVFVVFVFTSSAASPFTDVPHFRRKLDS